MVIKVEQKHIDEGVPDSSKYCPIACAIRETLKGAYAGPIRVCGNVSIGGKSYKLPEKAHKFISDFDTYKEVEPFEFELGEPPQYP